MDRSGAAGQMCVLSQTFVCSRLPSPTAGSFGQTAPEPSCVSSRLQAASRGITMKKRQPGHGAEFLPGGHRFRTASIQDGSDGVAGGVLLQSFGPPARQPSRSMSRPLPDQSVAPKRPHKLCIFEATHNHLENAVIKTPQTKLAP